MHVKHGINSLLLEFSVDAYVKLLEKGENGLYLSDEVKAMSF
jgi:hypothetical protein